MPVLFNKPHGVVVNKCLEGENPAEKFCIEKGIKILGKIPFDPDAVKAINDGQTIVDMDCASGRAAKDVFNRTMQILFKER